MLLHGCSITFLFIFTIVVDAKFRGRGQVSSAIGPFAYPVHLYNTLLTPPSGTVAAAATASSAVGQYCRRVARFSAVRWLPWLLAISGLRTFHLYCWHQRSRNYLFP